jgi:hypothetical protein
MRSLVVLAAALLLACMNSLTAKDELGLVIREYNDGVRWGRLEASVIHLPAEERQRFLARHSGLEDRLEILDIDLTRLDILRDAAQAQLDVTWSLKDRGIVERTVVDQSWRRRDGQWVLVKETRLRGATLTLFDEPAKSIAPTDAGTAAQKIESEPSEGSAPPATVRPGGAVPHQRVQQPL